MLLYNSILHVHKRSNQFDFVASLSGPYIAFLIVFYNVAVQLVRHTEQSIRDDL